MWTIVHIPNILLRYPPLGESQNSHLDHSEAFAQHLLAEADQSIESYNRSSSPTPHLSPISASEHNLEPDIFPSTPTHGLHQPHVHSPQGVLRTPIHNTILATEDPFNISPSSNNLNFASIETHDTPPSVHPLISFNSEVFVQRPVLPEEGASAAPSLASDHLVLAQEMAVSQPCAAPSPPHPGFCPWLRLSTWGFPLELHLGFQRFFETNVLLPPGTPNMTALILALRGRGNMLSDRLDHIFAGLDSKPFYIAWSKTMVEGADEFNRPTNGYHALRLLRDHLTASPVPVPRAIHNSVSTQTFEHLNLPLETPFFVLYCFPERGGEDIEASASPSPYVLPYGTRTTAIGGRTSRANTPAASGSGLLSLGRFLNALLFNCTFLDQHFAAEAGRLALIIQSIVTRADSFQSRNWQHDVAAWADLQRRELSADVRAKEEDLEKLLGAFFQVQDVGGNWRDDRLLIAVGGAQEAEVKRILQGYSIPPAKSDMLGMLPMTYC
ncbi:hypothetical protein R3P38DRAFT_3223455 [Favolaschia claudopus]|uniref:Uncharacterized protein n=1 Tax=Favolaschia claudopus TaxID=2862362 RepID=A0AAV9ZXP5_9AGAR